MAKRNGGLKPKTGSLSTPSPYGRYPQKPPFLQIAGGSVFSGVEMIVTQGDAEGLSVWSPDAFGWTPASEYAGPAEPEEPSEPEIADFVQPTGAHDAYAFGDLVRFEGAVYRSLIDANVWSPAVNPSGWELVN